MSDCEISPERRIRDRVVWQKPCAAACSCCCMYAAASNLMLELDKLHTAACTGLPRVWCLIGCFLHRHSSAWTSQFNLKFTDLRHLCCSSWCAPHANVLPQSPHSISLATHSISLLAVSGRESCCDSSVLVLCLWSTGLLPSHSLSCFGTNHTFGATFGMEHLLFSLTHTVT